MDKRIPDDSRLKHRREIQAVFAKRDVFRGQRLIFYRGPGPGDPNSGNQPLSDVKALERLESAGPAPSAKDATISRFCIVVTKKCGSAVRRNRIKRILREIIRRNRSRIVSGFDYVIRVDGSQLAEKVKDEDFLPDFKTYFRWN